MSTYIKHYDDNTLTHYGVKGMKWKKHIKKKVNSFIRPINRFVEGEDRAVLTYNARQAIERERHYQATRKNNVNNMYDSRPKSAMHRAKNVMEDMHNVGERKKSKKKYAQMQADNAKRLVKSILKRKKKRRKQ